MSFIPRFFFAFRVFFTTLFSSVAGRQVYEALEGRTAKKTALPAPDEKLAAQEPCVAKEPKKPTPPKAAARSDALTLLSALQREARFLDFLQEPLTGYSDAQIGAVARDVHRDCGAVVARMFAFEPAVPDEEGKTIEVPAGFDAGRFRLVGNVAGDPPFQGKLVHPGWEATKCEVPMWSGTTASARVVAPAEIELS